MKERTKRSPVWKIQTSELKRLVKKATSLGEVLRHFELSPKGRNHHTLKQRLLKDGIDFSHLPKGKASNKGRKFPNAKKLPLEVMLTANSTHSRGNLKRRLLEEGLLVNKCNLCGQRPMWKGKPLVLVIDHINGISNDHRLENLRLLCPNCNSQTDTFAGRQKKYFTGSSNGRMPSFEVGRFRSSRKPVVIT